MLLNQPVHAFAASPVTFKDARGQSVTVDNPKRIVSVGGAVTEILYAIGADDRIVGVDTTSVYPAKALTEKPSVGYMRQLSSEGVLGLNPQLILGVALAGPREVIDSLEAAKVPIMLLPEANDEKAILAKIATIAEVTGLELRGQCLANAVASDFESLRQLRTRITTAPRVLFVMSLLEGRAMVAGRQTAADEIIKLAGGVNAIESFDGYKTVNNEAIVTARPDVILAMDRGKGSVTADSVFTDPAFALTPAAAKKRFISMEGHYLLGFGPRTGIAARDLAVQFVPELKAGAEALPAASTSVDCRQ